MDIINLGKKIKSLRDKDGRSQEWVSKQIGTTRQTYAKWETGQTVPDIEMICRIADLFNISLDELTDRHIDANKNANNIKTYADAFRALFAIGQNIEHFSFEKANLVLLCIFADWKKINNLYVQNSIDEGTYTFFCNSIYERFKDIPYIELTKEQYMLILNPLNFKELGMLVESCSIDLILKILTSEETYHLLSDWDFNSSSYEPNKSFDEINAKKAFSKLEPILLESYNDFVKLAEREFVWCRFPEWIMQEDPLPFNF